jgi:hypothetical protein
MRLPKIVLVGVKPKPATIPSKNLLWLGSVQKFKSILKQTRNLLQVLQFMKKKV